MSANTNPIFGLTPNIGGVGNAALTAANNTYTGASGTTLTVFTAGTNGSFIQKIRFKAAGNCAATVARIFLNNGGADTTATNNILYDEVTLPITTASAVAATNGVDLAMNIPIPAGWTIVVAIATTVSAGYYITVIGEDY